MSLQLSSVRSGWLPAAVLTASLLGAGSIGAQVRVLGDPVDVSLDFQKLENLYFVGSRVTRFDPGTGRGVLQWDRYMRQPSYSFAKVDLPFVRTKANEFPGTEYPVSGLFSFPDGRLQTLALTPSAQGYTLGADPLRGNVRWRVMRFPDQQAGTQ